MDPAMPNTVKRSIILQCNPKHGMQAAEQCCFLTDVNIILYFHPLGRYDKNDSVLNLLQQDCID
jgi:hypothetical protein